MGPCRTPRFYFSALLRQQCSHLAVKRRRIQNAEHKWCKRCLLFGSSDYQGYQQSSPTVVVTAGKAPYDSWFVLQTSFEDFCFLLWAWLAGVIEANKTQCFQEKISFYSKTSVLLGVLCICQFCGLFVFLHIGYPWSQRCMIQIHGHQCVLRTSACVDLSAGPHGSKASRIIGNKGTRDNFPFSEGFVVVSQKILSNIKFESLKKPKT